MNMNMNTFSRFVTTLPLLVFLMMWLISTLLILVLEDPQSIGFAESASFSLSATIGIPVGFIGLILSKFIAARSSTDTESNKLEDDHEQGFKSLWSLMKIEVKFIFLTSATIFILGILNALFIILGNMMKIYN